MKSVIVAWLAALCLGLAAPVCVAQERTWTEITLAENDGLRAVVRFRNRASLADTDWFQIEIINSGPAGRIKSMELDSPSEGDGRSSSSALTITTLGVDADQHPLSSIGNTIPEGVVTTSTPGIYAGALFGLPKADARYVMHLTLSLELGDGRSLRMSKPGVSLAFLWARPDAAQMEALQKETVALLTKAIPSGGSSLSPAETNRMERLLAIEETSRMVTLDQALAAMKQRQREGSLRFYEVIALVFRRWKTDPAVIAFYREALQTRGPEAVADLAHFAVTIWDDSFIEPIVEVIEKAAQPWENVDAVERGVEFLNRNYAVWRRDASIPPRLSKAVREARPKLPNEFYNFTRLLPLTHDPAMIEFLRPYLADKTIDPFTSLSSNMPAGVTPMRYSELAANSISKLLGEPEMFDPWKRERVTGKGPYPEWSEWDARIAALQQRLAKRKQ